MMNKLIYTKLFKKIIRCPNAENRRFRFVILFFCLISFNSFSQTKQEEKKPKKKVLAQLGITLIDVVSELSIPDDFHWYNTTTGNFFSINLEEKSFQKRITLSASILLYKNIYLFSNLTYYNYGYSVSTASTGLGIHTINQYCVPLQLSYHHLLENTTTTYLIPKIGVTLTSHSEKINSADHLFQGDRVTLNNNYLYTLFYSSTTETPEIKHYYTTSLSGGVALKHTKPKMGEFEVGLSVIYNIKNPTAKYTIKTTKYDEENDKLLSEETEQVSFTAKNTIYQFYITWYPNFLRITKNK